MAIFFKTSTNYIVSLKFLLISTGVLTMAAMMKLSVPVIQEFVVSEVPLIWNFVLSCLRPPYLYLVINCIIITIVATSKLQQKIDKSPEAVIQPVAMKISGDVRMDYTAAYDGFVSKVEVQPEFGFGYDANVVKVAEVVEPQAEYKDVGVRVSEVKTIVNGSEMDCRNEFVSVNSRSSWTPQRQDSLEFSDLSEKPPVSVRFGHRKAVKSSPEAGKALRVSKPRRQDTLESTWKTITEGRPMPLTRHLRKSDTWESHARHNPQDQTPQKVKKSDTLTERSSNNSPSLSRSPGSGKFKKEPSLSQDELNRRVEAFIKKFTEEMRLQRQESLNQYHEMISRGVH